MTGEEECTYVCAPAIRWVKDLDQTILVDYDGQQSWILQGIDAAIWDLLTLGYGLEQTADFLAVLLTISSGEASHRLLATIQRWEQEGILQVPEGAQDA
jgi:hypothetical protein